jgi:hypothetical protein
MNICKAIKSAFKNAPVSEFVSFLGAPILLILMPYIVSELFESNSIQPPPWIVELTSHWIGGVMLVIGLFLFVIKNADTDTKKLR